MTRTSGGVGGRERQVNLGTRESYWSLGLDEIARSLNQLPGLSWPAAEAWRAAEGIVSWVVPDAGAPKGRTFLTGARPSSWPTPAKPLRLEFAARAFNRMTKKIPARLIIRGIRTKRGRLDLRSTVESPGEGGWAAWLLWRSFFQDEGWLRLKRCAQCRRWFVDTTRNHKKERCSKRCTWGWWNWKRRKEAHGCKGRKVAPRARRPGKAAVQRRERPGA